ncbi:hypothetical protein [Microbacterium hydrocarbonoxydans]|uniref:hypothetical protein n=1 Tax=Microbacterium hydrocarbonoxydans TaxID=273678 RepID=UPI003D99095A
MTDYTDTSNVLDMARRKPKAGKRRSKAWMIPAAIAVVFGGMLIIQPAAQAAVADAITPAVTATSELAAEAQTLAEQYEAICQGPAWDEALALTGGEGSAEAFDGVTDTCTAFAVENADFVDKVENATGLFTGLGEGFGTVTESIRRAVESGDIESAIRELFAQSEEAE